MIPPPFPAPQPVQPLAYSDPAYDDAAADRRLPPGFAPLMILLGAALLVAHGFSLIADLTRLGDPFYRKYRTQGITIGMAPVWLLATLAAAHVLAGCLQIAGAIGCVRRAPRAWARVALLAYALLEATAIVTSSVSTWLAQSRAADPGFTLAAQLLLRLGYTTSSLGLPLITLLLIRPRRAWPLHRP